MGLSLTAELVGKTLVVVHRPTPILDAEWDAMVLQLRDGDHTGVVIWANNHPPNSRHRNGARLAVQGRTKAPANVSILSDSVVIRTVVTIINVFVGDLVRMFSQTDLATAFAHASVAPEDAKRVTEAIERLREPLPAAP